MKSLHRAILRTGFAAMAAAGMAVPAYAAIITQTYNFTATGFTMTPGLTTPFSVVTGSFTVSFDNSVTVLYQPGVIINSISIPYQPGAAYDYRIAPTDNLGVFTTNYFTGTSLTPNVNGFSIGINNASSIASLMTGAFNYSTVGYNSIASTRNVTFTLGQPVANGVPEPATWAMMLAGFGLIGGALRRRQRVSVRYA